MPMSTPRQPPPAITAEGIFSGYASLFDRPDQARDIVAPGAFHSSLASRGPGGVKFLYQHDPAELIGVWLALEEDRIGLRVTGKLLPDVARARDVFALIRAGALDGLSIGFRAAEAVREPQRRLRRLKRIDLWEISVVTFPMLPGARIGA